MTVLERFLGVPAESRDVTYADVWGSGGSWNPISNASGKTVGKDSALALSAVYGAVRILSDGVATLPAVVMRGDGPDAEPVTQPPAWLTDPSPVWSPIDVRVQMMMSLLLRGNSFTATTRDGTGRVLELIPLDPDKVEVTYRRGRVWYEVTSGDSEDERAVKAMTYTPADVLHIRGLTQPGMLEGLSPLDYMKESVGLGLAAQEYGAAFFGNGALPGAVIEMDGPISPEGAQRIKDHWNDLHRGSGNAHKIGILSEGATAKPLSVSPEQAQFLETRGFQVADIARFFGVPPHLLQDASGSTSWGSGLAEQSVNYVTHSLRPWVERLEHGFTWLARSERPTQAGKRSLSVTLRLDHLMRGDWATRLSTYGSALDRGIFNLDEVRAFEGLPPLPDGLGQVHRVPLNTGPTGDPNEPTTAGDIPPATVDMGGMNDEV